MKIKELATKIKKINQESSVQIEKIRTKTSKENQKLFNQAVKLIFKTHPELESFSWSQYAPHWNDGDECTFSTHFDYELVLNGNDEEGGEDIGSLKENLQLIEDKNSETKIAKKIAELGKKKANEWEVAHFKGKLAFVEGLRKNPEEAEELKKRARIKIDIVDLLQSINDEYFQDMFGEGVITVTKDEVTVEDCEHD
jgi:hypothetical protein